MSAFKSENFGAANMTLTQQGLGNQQQTAFALITARRPTARAPKKSQTEGEVLSTNSAAFSEL